MDRMTELVEKLNDYAYRYYTLDEPIVSDKEYDALYDELVELESQTGTRLANSPTHRVGGELLKQFESHTHKQRLYSLAKSQSFGDLESWWTRCANSLNEDKFLCSVEYKYDGLTVNLTYNNGELVRATTRGNGVKGEIVTNGAKTIRTIPLTIDFKGEIEVQGECIMRLSELEKYNNTHDIPLKNARNAAAGALRNLDSKVTAERHLDFMAYSVGYSDIAFNSQKEMVDFLVKNKFRIGDYVKYADNLNDIQTLINEIESKRNTLDYLIDGAVIKINEQSFRNELGFTEKSPRWAMAYKYEAEEVTTILKDVIWQVSRTGKLNPLAVLEPVELCGATISRATLNNLDDIAKKGVKIGSRVFIRRSNDVIPEILGVAEDNNGSVILPPDKCPSCGGDVKVDGAFVYCENKENCGAVHISRLDHFASREAMNIEGLSEKTILQLYNLGFLRDIDDIYDLTAEQLIQAEGFKDKKVSNILNAIKNSKNAALDNFIYSLGIANIGKKSAKQLADKFKSLENLQSATIEDILSLDDFGEIMATSVYNFFNNDANKKLIDSLLSKGIQLEFKEVKQGVLTGITICLTGSISVPRSKAKQMIIDNGGSVADSVSKNVNVVVYGEEAGSKLEKAKKLGLELWTEKVFYEKINFED